MKHVLLILCLSMGLFAQAQNKGGFDVGNGGIVAKCQGMPDRWRSLDLLEGELHGRKPWSALKGLNGDQILEKVIQRGKKFCPDKFANYSNFVNVLKKSSHVLDWPKKGLITQDYHAQLPKGQCLTKQAVYQWRDGATYGPGQSRFYFDQNVWKSLEGLDRAALILHELMYRLYIIDQNRYQANSDAIRPGIAFLFSEDFGDRVDVACDVFPQDEIFY